MKRLAMILALMTGSAAFADGFVCENLAQNIRVKVFNHTLSDDGTRNAAIMILSDPSISDGHKTTAVFDADNSLVTNKGATYTSDVDLRYKTSDMKGRNIAGTKLGMVKYIILDVDFAYSQPVENGTQMGGQLILTKRNGDDDIRVDVTCVRYLKGE